VDSEGLPRNITFLQPFGTEFDRIALRLAAADRFTPGTHDGSPVAVAQSLEISVQACVDSTQDATGKQGFLLRLRSQPVQILGNLPEPPQEAAVTLASGVTAPIPLVHPEAEYTEEARKARNQGDCIISVIVDAQGMPQNPRVVRGLGMGLDQKAIEAVNKYRFRPAMKNGEPVPIRITVEVSFRFREGS
jgi:TonB family protein